VGPSPTRRGLYLGHKEGDDEKTRERTQKGSDPSMGPKLKAESKGPTKEKNTKLQSPNRP